MSQSYPATILCYNWLLWWIIAIMMVDDVSQQLKCCDVANICQKLIQWNDD